MRIEKMKNLRESDYVNLRIQMRNSKSYEGKTFEKNLLMRATTTEKSGALRLQRYSKQYIDQSDMTRKSCMIEQHKSELC